MARPLSKKAKREELDNVLRFIISRCVVTNLPLSEYRDWINYRLYQAQAVEYVRDALKNPVRSEDDADEDATRTMATECEELVDAFSDEPEPDELLAAFELGVEVDPDYETPIIQRTDTIEEMENAIKAAAKKTAKAPRSRRR